MRERSHEYRVGDAKRHAWAQWSVTALLSACAATPSGGSEGATGAGETPTTGPSSASSSTSASGTRGDEQADVGSPSTSSETADASTTTGDEMRPTRPCAATPIADEVTQPIGPHELVPGEMYVVYSELRQEGSPWVETSNTLVMRGESDADGVDVWIFGTGYGDGVPLDDFPPPRPSQYPSRSGAADAEDTHAVIRDCLALAPARVRLRFITPHYHFDHLNYDFVGALVEHGYAVDRLQIQVHALDDDAAFCGEACRGTPSGGGSIPPFPPELEARAQVLGTEADACGVVVASFTTPALGEWSVRLDDGHTEGTLTADNATLGVRLRGAAMGCLPVEPTLVELRPHGPLAAAWAMTGR